MNTLDYDKIFKRLNEYMDDDKKRTIDPDRKRDLNRAYEVAQFLFPKADIKIEMEFLQTGVLTLCIEQTDIDVCEKEMISSFAEIIRKADCIRISNTEPDELRIALMFRCVNT